MDDIQSKEYIDKCSADFHRLFDAAKQNDQFEYCCALLRIKGTRGPGWDTLVESSELLWQCMHFISTPIDPKF